MEHRFNPGDRVVFIGEAGHYINFSNIDIAGLHGEILDVEAEETIMQRQTQSGHDFPFYNVKFDGILSSVYVYESLLSFELEYECSDDAAIDQGSINLFLGI